MKNKLIIILLFFVTFMPINSVNAEETVETTKNDITTAIIIKNQINFRKSPTTSSNTISQFKIGTIVNLINKELTAGSGCTDGWYNVKYNENIGYVCSSYLSLISEENKDYTLYTLGEKAIRKVPNTSDDNYIIENIKPGTFLKVINQVPANSTCGSKYWYYAEYDKSKGWICGYNVSVIPKSETEDQDFLNNVLPSFPKSYYPYLIDLHVKHPSWIFEAYDTGVTLSEAVTKEATDGYALTNSKYQGFYSILEVAYDHTTDTFKPKDGSSWFSANEQTISYYMDPRNYLTESKIFAFEKLSNDTSSHTLESVQATLKNFGNLYPYAQAFLTAGAELNVSPIHLASRSIQEIGSTTTAISGGQFTCSDGKTYSGYYNFYNIGAFSSNNPVITGLCNAVKYGWNSPEKSIVGGAKTIANGYVNAGQDTLYLQKYNVKNGKIGITHQYMTNIAAPMSESSITYSGYSKSNILDTPFTFKIPVYKNMEENISTLPLEGNPNNWLKTVTIDNEILSTFDTDTYNYIVNVSSDKKTIELGALPVNSASTVVGTGKIDLSTTKTTKLIVKAQNKTERTYTFDFNIVKPLYTNITEVIDSIGIKNDGTYITNVTHKTITNLINEAKSKNANSNLELYDKDSNLKTTTSFYTGDKLVAKLGDQEKTYIIVLNGDTNGDGEITILDLLRVQKHILESSKLDKEYLLAADVNGDSKVTILDLLKVQKHILGQGIIE